MTDISVFTVEERLIAAVWVHDRIVEYMFLCVLLKIHV